MTNVRHTRALILLAAVTASLVAACGGPARPAVGEVRTIVLPAKPPDCPLQLVTVGAAEMMPGAPFGPGGEYEMIGTVTLGLPRGTDVLSEDVRKLVRPRACAMGGAALSLVGSGDAGHYVLAGDQIRTVAQTDAAFIVWGRRGDAPGPQAF